jgi:hypothetical protein
MHSLAGSNNGVRKARRSILAAWRLLESGCLEIAAAHCYQKEMDANILL